VEAKKAKKTEKVFLPFFAPFAFFASTFAIFKTRMAQATQHNFQPRSE
jgi:hypothetical protein